MKKVLLMLVAGAFISTSLISCSKCGHCQGGTYPTTEVCQKTNQTAYDVAKEACETGGGNWQE